MVSYRGHCITTCSTVSAVLHVVHIGVMEHLRLCNDWLRRARLKRRRDTMDDAFGDRVLRYDGMDVLVHIGLSM